MYVLDLVLSMFMYIDVVAKRPIRYNQMTSPKGHPSSLIAVALFYLLLYLSERLFALRKKKILLFLFYFATCHC